MTSSLRQTTNNSNKCYTISVMKTAMQHYDAVIVLGCNITPVEDGFAPTTYKDHDQYGMLAGEMNVIAAVHLLANRQTDTFVFSTGTSQKTKAAFGEDAPTEAEVYSIDFVARLQRYRKEHHDANLPEPTIILEDRSVNTYSNITEVLEIIRTQGWKKVAIMSARYHVPRVKALCEMILSNGHVDAVKAEITFLMSEDIIVQAAPGQYDAMIAEAYSSEQGQKRLAIEAQGLSDIQEGRYVISEFQLHQAHQS